MPTRGPTVGLISLVHGAVFFGLVAGGFGCVLPVADKVEGGVGGGGIGGGGDGGGVAAGGGAGGGGGGGVGCAVDTGLLAGGDLEGDNPEGLWMTDKLTLQSIVTEAGCQGLEATLEEYVYPAMITYAAVPATDPGPCVHVVVHARRTSGFVGIDMVLNDGSTAFFGPRIVLTQDFAEHDFQCSLPAGQEAIRVELYFNTEGNGVYPGTVVEIESVSVFTGGESCAACATL